MLWLTTLCVLTLSQTWALNNNESGLMGRLCKQWNCINTNIGSQSQGILLDKHKLETYLSDVLDEEWKVRVRAAVEVCLGERKPRAYSRSCPGQQTWHCIVDQLIENCPDRLVKKDDVCTPVASFITAKSLFYQTAYTNFKNESKADPRPIHTLTNAFSSKCCDLPPLFNSSLLQQCHADSFLKVSTDQHRFFLSRPTAPQFKYPAKTDNFCSEPLEPVNPFECCDMSEIVQPSVFDSCSVKLEWQKEKRLTLVDEEIEPPTEPAPAAETTTKKYHKKTDVKVVPISCTGVTCVFRKLNITTGGGVDKAAYTRLLAEMVRARPEWAPARGRVLAHCLQRDLRHEYDGCEANKLLACTYDILSEHCPHAKKGVLDPCRHPSKGQSVDVVCQVNLSKYRRIRHRYCDVPSLVPPAVLAECNLTSLTHMTVSKREYNATGYKQRLPSLLPACKSTTNGTNCIFSKLGVLGKYNFMDYQRMRTLLDGAVEKSAAWVSRRTQLGDAVRLMPRYGDYCVSTRRFLNVLDTAVETCPLNKRRYTSKCTRFYSHLTPCSPKRTHHFNPLTFLATNHTYVPTRHIAVALPPQHSVLTIPGYNNKAVLPLSFRKEMKIYWPTAVYSPMYAHEFVNQAAVVPIVNGKKVKNVFKSNPRAEDSFKAPLEQAFPVEANGQP